MRVALSYCPSIVWAAPALAGYMDPPITLPDGGETPGGDGLGTLVFVHGRSLIGRYRRKHQKQGICSVYAYSVEVKDPRQLWQL
ncbi:hypothetical protein DFJ58DRAFT_817338 [Suillus subalutaceus]|uniref:uncharacterized protein n=1 Tax=Suillus subalutaceus TaxID=48586 RepID=UPI001B86E058|nr:uncharacterized protein DFJ58DRAFT_817338 [Suillus subalutaceus]KAG1836884.1 hypothetical protein DFJ58DRAFT_817338 [Suillus subalutaceus]